MGGDDPVGKTVKGVVNTGTKLLHDPASWAARRLGLSGVADGIDKMRDFQIDLANKTTDLATGEAGRQKQKAKDAQAAAEKKAGVARAAAAATAKKNAFDQSEKERMSVGSGARTLLTGPAGLEDSSEEDQFSLSRKTLKGV